jgi:hypothetical protein
VRAVFVIDICTNQADAKKLDFEKEEAAFETPFIQKQGL